MGYELDLKRIKPENVKRSDKYSKQIYKFLKENERCRRVFYNKCCYDSDSGNYVKKEFDIEKIRIDSLYFGTPSTDPSNEIIGKCVRELVGNGRGKYEKFCYLCENDAEFVEVTEEFFEKYIAIGRCIYDDHFWLQDEELRYTCIDSSHRRCNWCGKEQEEIEVIEKYKHKEWK